MTKNNDHTASIPQRLDVIVVKRGLAPSRSRAEEYIKSGHVSVNGRVVKKAGYIADNTDKIILKDPNPYVSRAALKLKSAVQKIKVNFKDKTVLDVGSSTGGFSEFALKSGAKKVIAVDVGTDQMHPLIKSDARIELHEKTDIRDFVPKDKIDVIVGDVSFISLRMIIPHLLKISTRNTELLLMCKPQFEAGRDQVNKGVIKNEAIRRKILADFETWLKTIAIVLNKADSDTPGEKGNIERFFLIKKIVK